MEMIVWNKADVADRGLSKSLWSKCPLLQYQFGIGGTFYFNDFQMFPAATLTTATASEGYLAILDSSCEAKAVPSVTNGEAQLVTTVTAADFAYLTLMGNVASMLKLSNTAGSNKKVWFETCFKVDVLATTSFFVGVLEQACLASSLLTTAFADDIAAMGLLKLSGGSAADIIMNDTSGAETVLIDDVVTPVVSTWYKYGFYYDSKACYQYLDGTIKPPDASPTSHGGTLPSTTNFPNNYYMTPVWGMYSTGAVTKMNIDWVAVAVEL